MTQQVETATVLGTITLTGNATVIVTSAYMSASPKTLQVAVTDTDTASIVADKIREALAFDADVSALFLVSGTGADVILTSHIARANDATLNISIANGTCAGLTNALTSANTTAGSGLSNAYATLAEFKSWVAVRGLEGSVGTDVSDDATIEILIEAASRYIDRETGKRFYLSGEETRYYTTTERFEVKIDPLAEITSVSVDYSGIRSYTEITNYDLYPYNAQLDGLPYTHIYINNFVSGDFFPSYLKAVQVVGRFGFPVIPIDINEATLSIAQSLNSTRSGQSTSGNVTVTAAGVVIRPQDVPAFAQKIIKNYRTLT